MTFKRFEEIFKSRYPNGTVYMHDEFCHGEAGKRHKVGVEFFPNGKVYMYSGAYEEVLCKMGIKTISKERLAALEESIEYLKRRHGDVDIFFGLGYIDNMREIMEREAFLAEVHRDYVIG